MHNTINSNQYLKSQDYFIEQIKQDKELEKSNTRVLRKRLFILFILSILSILIYLFWEFPEFGGFIMKLRSKYIITAVTVGVAVSIAAMVFQAIVNNRIITPSILGLDNLYLLLQTTVVFILGGKTLLELDDSVTFFATLSLMIIFALILFKIMFSRENLNVFFVLLMGIVFGTLFSSLTTFMATLLSPGEFFIVMDIGFASLDKAHLGVISIGIAIVVACLVVLTRYYKYLDVLSLGKEHALGLGVNYYKITLHLLIIVTILTSVATAIVGPMAFLGLLTMNITIQYMRTHRYAYLVPASACVGVITIMIGQIVLQRLFNYDSTLSIIINFAGGLYFIYLLLRENKKW